MCNILYVIQIYIILFSLPMPWLLDCGASEFLFFDMDYNILHTEVRTIERQASTTLYFVCS